MELSNNTKEMLFLFFSYVAFTMLGLHLSFHPITNETLYKYTTINFDKIKLYISSLVNHDPFLYQCLISIIMFVYVFFIAWIVSILYCIFSISFVPFFFVYVLGTGLWLLTIEITSHIYEFYKIPTLQENKKLK